MALNLNRTVVEFLKTKPEEKFTAREIANWIFETYPNECREKKEKSTATAFPLNSDTALIQQLVAEIGAQRPRLEAKHAGIKTTDGRPRRYYFTELSDEAEIDNSNLSQTSQPVTTVLPYTEHSLYPVLSQFLWHDLDLYSKRIDEKRSKNAYGAGGNKWLFPDVVGLEDLSRDWHREIKDIVQETSDQKTKLWSFEVKKLINRSNVREVYFQAVSNSSWANFGYLVAAEIQGAEKELRMLSALHGIGVIKLDVESPSDSEIMIPSQERKIVDWNAANRLAEENSDFLSYIKLIRQFYQTGEHRDKDWDIPSDEVR
jgi:uncharacterized protein